MENEWLIPNLTCVLFFNTIWLLENKSNVRKLSNIFTFWGSCLLTVTSIMYIVTQRSDLANLSHSVFYIHMLFELGYGYFYFPQYMYGLTTYLHHFVYLFFEYFLICKTNHYYLFVYYFPQEFPTFLLACKRYFEIDNDVYNLVLLGSFVFFRFFYFLVVSYQYRMIIQENYVYTTMFFMITLLQSKWCMELLQKSVSKIPYGYFSKNKKKSFTTIPTIHALCKTPVPFSEISFHSSGWMQIFQCGVSKYIQENMKYDECKLVGTSGGALIACSLCCDLPMDDIFDEMIKTRKIYNNNIFKMCHYTKKIIEKMLPEKCIDLIKKRLTIVCSKLEDYDFIPLYMDNFHTYTDVLKYLHATIHVPIIDGCTPYEIDNLMLYDGMMSDSHPQLTDNCLHVTWDNSGSRENAIVPEFEIPHYWCALPPDENTLKLLYFHGYYQAKKFFTKGESTTNAAETINSELREKIKQNTDLLIYILKGGFLFFGCFCFSQMVV